MGTSGLEQFRAALMDFQQLLDQVSITLAAVRVQQHWVALFVRIVYGSNAHDRLSAQELLQPTPEMLTARWTATPEEFDPILEELLASGTLRIDLARQSLVVHLTRQHAGIEGQPNVPISFSALTRTSRWYQKPHEQFVPQLQLHYSLNAVYQLTSSEVLTAASNSLRIGHEHYDGLEDLFAQYGVPRDLTRTSDTGSLELVIALPFEMSWINDAVHVELPSDALGSVRLLASFTPKGGKQSLTASVIRDGTFSRITASLEWPDDATAAVVHLYFGSRPIDQLDVHRWPRGKNWRAAVDEFFDPDQKALLTVLLTRTDSQGFERGLVRLFSLCDLASVWYGNAPQEGRPDLVIFVQPHHNERLVLLGECTLQKPLDKLSPLKARAKQLQEKLGGHASVRPLLFTTCEPAESDYKACEREGITLIGSRELGRIVEQLANGQPAAAIVKSLLGSESWIVLPRIR